MIRPLSPRSTEPHRRSSTLICALFSAVAIACGATTFWPIYRSQEFVVMAVVSIAVGSCIAVAGAVFRLSSAIVAVLTVAAFLAFGVALAVPGEALAGVFPSWQGMLDLLSGAALGWKQLVTIVTPVGAYQALLVPAFLLILLCCVVCLTIALRAPRGEWSLLVPVGLFIAGIVLGPAHVDAPAVAALALLGTLLFWLAWFRRSRGREAIGALRGGTSGRASGEPGGLTGRATGRRDVGDPRRSGGLAAFSASVVIVLAAAAGAGAAALVPPAAQREVARSAFVQPFNPRDYPSPLAGFRSWLEPAQAERPMLTVRGLHGERRIRISTMDTYDGVVFSVGGSQNSSGSATFARIPGRIDQPDASGRDLTLDVTVDDYRGVWLPGIGTMREVQFQGPRADALRNAVYFNSTTGATAVLGGLHHNDRYELHTTVGQERTIAQLADQTPGTAVEPKLGVVPEGLDAALQQSAGTVKQPGQKLSAALKSLVDRGYISHGISSTEPISRSGHGADRIAQLLTDRPMVGDQEQYATTAALMARQLGFPARVVIGFLVPSETASHGTVTVTGADISAWIQVQTKQSGWVTVDPTPAVRPIPEKQPQDPKHISRPQSEVEPPPETVEHSAAPAQPSHVARNDSDADDPLIAALWAAARIAGWSVLGLALVLSPFAAILTAKWRRRHRRKRANTSIERITGGWREFADSALDHGFTPPASATRSEIAQTVGGVRPLGLATATDRAVFAPSEPTPDDADRIWQVVDELLDSFGQHKTRWQRIRAAVSLASLGGYRGRDGKGAAQE
jgi:hypothetical protein